MTGPRAPAVLLAALLSAGPATAQKPRVLGGTPVPTPEVLAEEREFVEAVIDPKNTLDLVAGRPRVILLKAAPTRTQIADARIAGLTLAGPGGTHLVVQGDRVGITVLNLWFPDPADKGKEKVLSYLVRVLPDPEAKARAAAALVALAREVNVAFPDSRVRLVLVGGARVLSGQARDPVEAAKILRTVK